jgi:hypothetical protein
MRTTYPVLTASRVEDWIITVRGQKVMLDSNLASLYGVSTSRLNEQVKRNRRRFPADFMFQLTRDEHEALKSQFAISKPGRGGRRRLPYAFTEHGAVMLASVLNSHQAVEVSIFVVRAFVRLRQLTIGQQEAVHRLSELERRISGHDEDLKTLIDAIRQLMSPPQPPKRRTGFTNQS